MKKVIFLLVCVLTISSGAAAQKKQRNANPSPEERQQWLTELRNYKHEFLAQELDLNKEQQAAFFPLYDQMDDELTQIATETREMEAAIEKADAPTDEELQEGALALFQQKGRESAVELAYFEKYKEVLTPKQLFRLKNAERKFTQQLVRKHHGQPK